MNIIEKKTYKQYFGLGKTVYTKEYVKQGETKLIQESRISYLFGIPFDSTVSLRAPGLSDAVKSAWGC